MRLLFFTHYFPPEVNAPATRTFDHCVRWARAGHDVTVVTCAPNCPNGVLFPGYKNRLWPQTEFVEGVRVIRIWTYLAANAGIRRRIVNYLSYILTALLASIRLRPDVVVATSPQFFCGWAGVLASRLKRVPLVLEIRDIWPESIEAVGAIRNRPLLWFLGILECWMYGAAQHIVTVGDAYRDNILEKVDVSDRISVITNGVDVLRFVPREPDTQWLQAWRLEGKFVCSWIGTIGMAHGLGVVIEAAKILKKKDRQDITFLLVGEGARRKQLEEEKDRAGLGDAVVFAGKQPKENIPSILASSDACLIHLKKRALFRKVIPSKIFETLAMARPIIVGVEGQARRIVMEAGGGVEMEPDCPESLVKAVEKLASAPEWASQQCRAAHTYVTQHFNRDALADRFLNLLGEVANVSPSDETLGEAGHTLRKAA